MFKLILIFGICLIFSVFANTRDKRQEQQCYTPDNHIGICIYLSSCQYLNNLYTQSGNNPQNINFLNAAQRNCGNRNIQGQPVVCCAQNRREQLNQKISSSGGKQPNDGKRVNQCAGPDGVSGVCKGLRDCRTLIDRLQENPQDASFARFLRLSNEVCRLPAPTICCPSSKSNNATAPNPPRVPAPKTAPKPTLGGTQNVNRIPTAAEGCGLSKNRTVKTVTVDRDAAKIGAWPWITLLAYTDSFGKSSFRCGGALITQRHVLTAAHCIRTDLSFIRLGEVNLNSETETGYVDINIVKKVTHPSYSKKDGHSDVAILRLERGAPFTNLIRPICLPTPQLRAKSYVNYSPFVTGWGKTQEGGNSSPILQELQIPIHPNEVCSELYQRFGIKASVREFDNGVICAGVLGKGTCPGDSGGPLMVPETVDGGIRFYVIGIISHGIATRPDIPQVFTRVAQFMPWIEHQVADNSYIDKFINY